MAPDAPETGLKESFISKPRLTYSKMAIELVKVSSKGQVVLPKEIRDEAGVAERDKLLVITDERGILLQKVDERQAKKELLSMLDYFGEKFRKAGITKADVEKEIRAARAEKYGKAGS